MGFLRKVGRKIKKGVKKLFSSKLGSIVGMVGLYFVMGGVAKQLSKWGNSIFGGKTAAVAEGTAATEAALSSTELSNIAKGTDTLSSSVKALTDGTAKGSTVSIDTMLGQAATNSDKANIFMSAQESAILSGTSQPTLNTTLTGAVETASNSSSVFTQTGAEVSKNLAQPMLDTAQLASDVQQASGAVTPTEAIDFTDFTSVESGQIKGVTRTGEAITSTAQPGKGMLTPKEGFSVQQAAADPARYATLGPDATMGERLSRFAQDPVGITRGKIQNVAADTAAYVTGPEFIPETVQGLGAGYVANVLAPDIEEPFRSAGVSSQPFQEQAQAAHMQTVAPQLAAAGLGNVRSFSDLANQTLYGTGTPNYMQGIYQPLPIPTLAG